MVLLSKIIDGLEMVSDEIDCYYDPKTNEIFCSNIGEYSDLTEGELEELFSESIILPTRYEINEYSMMEYFIDEIKDENIQKGLRIAIQGKGAFRRFKDVCVMYGMIDRWYKYKNERYKEIAINWCKENNIEFEVNE